MVHDNLTRETQSEIDTNRICRRTDGNFLFVIDPNELQSKNSSRGSAPRTQGSIANIIQTQGFFLPWHMQIHAW